MTKFGGLCRPDRAAHAPAHPLAAGIGPAATGLQIVFARTPDAQVEMQSALFAGQQTDGECQAQTRVDEGAADGQEQVDPLRPPQ